MQLPLRPSASERFSGNVETFRFLSSSTLDNRSPLLSDLGFCLLCHYNAVKHCKIAKGCPEYLTSSCWGVKLFLSFGNNLCLWVFFFLKFEFLSFVRISVLSELHFLPEFQLLNMPEFGFLNLVTIEVFSFVKIWMYYLCNTLIFSVCVWIWSQFDLFSFVSI